MKLIESLGRLSSRITMHIKDTINEKVRSRSQQHFINCSTECRRMTTIEYEEYRSKGNLLNNQTVLNNSNSIIGSRNHSADFRRSCLMQRNALEKVPLKRAAPSGKENKELDPIDRVIGKAWRHDAIQIADTATEWYKNRRNFVEMQKARAACDPLKNLACKGRNENSGLRLKPNDPPILKRRHFKQISPEFLCLVQNHLDKVLWPKIVDRSMDRADEVKVSICNKVDVKKLSEAVSEDRGAPVYSQQCNPEEIEEAHSPRKRNRLCCGFQICKKKKDIAPDDVYYKQPPTQSNLKVRDTSEQMFRKSHCIIAEQLPNDATAELHQTEQFLSTYARDEKEKSSSKAQKAPTPNAPSKTRKLASTKKANSLREEKEAIIAAFKKKEKALKAARKLKEKELKKLIKDERKQEKLIKKIEKHIEKKIIPDVPRKESKHVRFNDVVDVHSARLIGGKDLACNQCGLQTLRCSEKLNTSFSQKDALKSETGRPAPRSKQSHYEFVKKMPASREQTAVKRHIERLQAKNSVSQIARPVLDLQSLQNPLNRISGIHDIAPVKYKFIRNSASSGSSGSPPSGHIKAAVDANKRSAMLINAHSPKDEFTYGLKGKLNGAFKTYPRGCLKRTN